MNPFTKYFFPCLIIFGFNSVKSQDIIIGATANAGMSKVTSNLPHSGDFKAKYTPSGNLGVFLEKRIGKKSALGIEALWVQIEGNEGVKNLILTGYDNQGLQELGVISTKSRLHTSYAGVPIYYRLAFGKFGIKAGAQPMLFLFASSSYKAKGLVSGKPYKAANKTKDLKFDRVDIGPKLGIDYQLNNKLRLRADFYYGLIDITPDEFPWQRRYRQFTTGVQYFFGN